MSEYTTVQSLSKLVDQVKRACDDSIEREAILVIEILQYRNTLNAIALVDPNSAESAEDLNTDLKRVVAWAKEALQREVHHVSSSREVSHNQPNDSDNSGVW